MSKKSSIKDKGQIIGNYLVSPFISVWLAKEFNLIDFNYKADVLSSEEAFILRCVASYENYKRFGNGSYEGFRDKLINKKGR